MIGVIGGSGLYQIDGLADVRTVAVATPFGLPSDRFVLGRLGDVTIAFLPRHGRGHRISPTELNFRANIYALKALGVEMIIAVSAVGSLRAEIAPGSLVLPDQFIDRTRGRISTFFRGWRRRASLSARPFTRPGPTCVSRGHSSPPELNRSSTGAGVPMSSA
jgi:5'-methylthioadenosine phosphorylase